MIEVASLRKTYRIARRPSGAFASVRSLFHRTYADVHALDGASFSIADGESVGLIGPNGAGKSTLVKILSGILVPDGGSVTVDGVTPWRERVRYVANIGVVFGQRSQLWWDVPVRDSFDLLCEMYRLRRADYDATLAELSRELAIEPLLGIPARSLSLGQRMRCELAAALLHRPRLLFLDEPTIGLDAASKLAMRGFLSRMLASRGVTLLLTTHDMEDIEALCPRVLLIGHGRILYDGTMQNMRAAYDRTRVVQVEYESPDTVPAWPGVIDRRAEGLGFQVDVSRDAADLPNLVHALEAAGDVKDLRIERQGIDEILSDLYREMAL